MDMLNAIGGAQSTQAANLIFKPATSAAGVSADAFAEQLATAIEGYLGKAGNGTQFEIDVQPGQGQNSGTGQFTVTVKELNGSTAAPTATAPATTTAPAPAVPTAADTGPLMASTIGASAKAAGQPQTPAIADKSTMTPDQAYWAEQPAAVQALQTMPDNQKLAAAQVLAEQGYSIDVPIMVWGWDPLATMTVRQNDGLTWVPSALQPNIPVAPGDTFPGLATYDANTPPPGSIKVTTDFAIGTNGQDPWVKSGVTAT
jgi:hypothetical protein